jgi:hypothetical protein
VLTIAEGVRQVKIDKVEQVVPLLSTIKTK